MVTGVFLLSLHNPVEIAEQTATLEVITGGRFIFGVGVGNRDIPCAEFGVVPEHRGARTGESIQVIKLLWTEDEVTYQGQHFSLSLQCQMRHQAYPEASSSHLDRSQCK